MGRCAAGRHPRGDEEDPEFQMAPMIDVVFLLLIFFMCASTFDQLRSAAEVPLPVARLPEMDPAATALVVNLCRTAGGGQVLIHGDERFDSAAALLDRVAATTEHSDPSRPAVVRAESAIAYGYVDEVLTALRRANAS